MQEVCEIGCTRIGRGTAQPQNKCRAVAVRAHRSHRATTERQNSDRTGTEQGETAHRHPDRRACGHVGIRSCGDAGMRAYADGTCHVVRAGPSAGEIAKLTRILAEGAIALSVTLSGGALFAN